MNHTSAEAAPTQPILPFLTSLSLYLKEQEQGRTRERKWRLEMEVEDGVKACNPRSSLHQAQLIPTS
jgi:hypothetical protein